MWFTDQNSQPFKVEDRINLTLVVKQKIYWIQFHCRQVRYSIEPKDRIYVKEYEFLSFAKNMGKNLSNKYSQKLLDSAKKSTADAIETASKRAIQKQQTHLAI